MSTFSLMNRDSQFNTTNGGVDVNVQDQTTRPLDLYFLSALGSPTTLSATADKDDLSVDLTSTTGFVDGVQVGIFQPAANNFYFGTQLGAPSGSTITLDTPLDREYASGLNAIPASRELNVDGSSTSKSFLINGVGGSATASVDITRLIFKMFTSSAPVMSDFGDISGGLTNGLVLRKNNGVSENIWNIKTNGDLANLAYDLTFYTALGVGQDGLACRYTFAGQDKHGVAVRLAPGETLELIVQDDLTDLESFRVLAQGHIVDD